MEIQIQTVKFDADKKLIDFIEKKLSRLDKFTERSLGADVILKLDKDSEKGNKVAIIRLEVPGNDLIAESRGRTFEDAVDDAIDALKRQIERRKDRL